MLDFFFVLKGIAYYSFFDLLFYDYAFDFGWILIDWRKKHTASTLFPTGRSGRRRRGRNWLPWYFVCIKRKHDQTFFEEYNRQYVFFIADSRDLRDVLCLLQGYDGRDDWKDERNQRLVVYNHAWNVGRVPWLLERENVYREGNCDIRKRRFVINDYRRNISSISWL